MPVAEIQTGGNSFRKIRYLFRKIIIFNEHHSISANNTNFCEFCKKDARFQKGGVIFANSAKMAHVSHGYNLSLIHI